MVEDPGGVQGGFFVFVQVNPVEFEVCHGSLSCPPFSDRKKFRRALASVKGRRNQFFRFALFRRANLDSGTSRSEGAKAEMAGGCTHHAEVRAFSM
jgi:hypothetical protein